MDDIASASARNTATSSPDHATAPALSRRSFVELAAGAHSVLPAVAVGFALTFGPERAYAAESSGATTKVVIAKANEAGIAVADVGGVCFRRVRFGCHSNFLPGFTVKYRFRPT